MKRSLIFKKEFPNLSLPRPLDSHKGSFGTLGIIGGAVGMGGAPLLSGKAGLKIGAGRVIIGFAQSALPLPLIPDFPELMLATAENLLDAPESITAWSFGSGLGLTEAADHLLTQILALTNHPIVFDADALTLLAKRKIASIQPSSLRILTPHPKEASRLLGITTTEIQANREQSAMGIAKKYQALTVLKGHKTLVATPTKIIWKNNSGNPGLSTAGTGDVLAGIISGLLAQSIPMNEAASAGVWLHGKAADSLVDRGIGPIGLTASELIDEARMIRNRLTFNV